MRDTRLIVALDTQDPETAKGWAEAVGASAGAVKLGLEFAYAAGMEEIASIAAQYPVFLDLKLHDIPNTVAGAIRSLARIRPVLLTIHASGGRSMIAAARKALDEAFPADARPVLLAVTVLTSLDEAELHEMGISDSVEDQVLRLARMALDAGADGLVCSAHELAALRQAFGDKPVLVTPGIRPAGTIAGDQKRIMTPSQAREAGADWIVVGRPITEALDPSTAAAAIVAELRA